MKKRILSVLLALCMVLGMLPGTARAAEVGSGYCGAEGNNVTWTLDDAGLLTISGNGKMKDYDNWITYVPWYKNWDNIRSIVIGSGVTSIGRNAADRCKNLERVDILGNVTSIGLHAFLNCSSLTSITIPSSVTSIGIGAFAGCSSLASITIPSGVTSIGESAFARCSGLTSITIPSSVTSIGGAVFSNCSNLTNVTILASSAEIGESLFSGCSKLESITISPDNTAFSVDDGVLFNASKTKLFTYPSSKTDSSYVVPASVTSVSTYAFRDNSSLKTITFLGNAPTVSADYAIGDYADTDELLAGCSGITVRYPYGNATWTDEIFNPEFHDGDPNLPAPYSFTTLTITTESTTGDESPLVVITSSNLPFDAVTGSDPGNYKVTSGGYNVTNAAVSSDGMSVTLTLEAAGARARAGDISINVAAAAFISGVELTDENALPIASVSQSVQLPGSPTETPTEETTEEPFTETPAGPSAGPSTEPPEIPWTPSVPSTPPAPSQPSPSTAVPSAPYSIEVEDELEIGGPGDVMISAEGESDMQAMVKSGEFIDWIDRVDLPDYATDLYTVLCIGGDNDALFDILISDKYQQVSSAGASAASEEEADIESVLELVADLNLPYSSGQGLFQGDSFTGGFATIDAAAGDRAIDYGDLKEGDVVRTSAYNGIFVTKIRKDGNANFEEDKKAASTYAATAFQAFDRDHPEVFWLSGKNKLRLTTVTMKDGNETYKETYIFFVLADADGFSVRDPLYPDQASIEAAIARRDAAVETILSTVTATAPNEQAAQLNRWLTEHNHYNTSEDLYSISNAPHECLSALEGNIGTDGPVCDGYSRAFKVLCDKLKIPCVLVDGYALTKADGPGEFHMWNSVQIDGQWYGVDVTWNDPTVKGIDAAKSGHEREDFLLVGGDTVVFGLKFSVSHPPKNRAVNGGVAFVNGPSLSTEAFNPMAGITVLPFRDVTAGSWYYSAVEYAYEHGLMTGETGSSFAPDGSMTRAMVWTVLARMAGMDVSGGTPWYAPAQAWAVDTGVSDGSNPGGNISREELVTMLWRAQGSPDAAADLSGFTDSGTVSGWAVDAVQWAVSTGLLEGSDGLIDPASRATRAEVAALLARFLEASGA